MLAHDLHSLLVLWYSWSSWHNPFRLLTDDVALMSHLLAISNIHPLWLFPASVRTSSNTSHFFMQSGLLLLLPMSLVLSLVKEGAAHFLFALLNLLKQAQLAHLIDKVLVLLLLLCDLLFFKLLLSLLLFQVSLGFFILLNLLNKETAPHAPWSTVLSCTVLDQESSKSVVLSFRRLQKYKGFNLQHEKLFGLGSLERLCLRYILEEFSRKRWIHFLLLYIELNIVMCTCVALFHHLNHSD